MKKIIRIPAVTPRYYQYNFWQTMDRGAVRGIKSWPRRFGKDISDFSYLVKQAINRSGAYYYYFPTLEDAKKALWDNIVEFWENGDVVAAGNMMDILCPKELRIGNKNESEHMIRVRCKGAGKYSTIKLGGTDNLKVIGQNGHGYVFSEWQSQKPEAFGLIAPILRQNRGWALFNGTMRGKSNHLYKDIHTNMGRKGWYSEWLKATDAKEYYWINESEGICVNPELKGQIHPHTLLEFDNIQDLVDSGQVSLNLARQEFLNDAVSQTTGAYYAYEIERMASTNRLHVPMQVGRDELVYTFWDLGGTKEKSDTTAIVFATINGKKINIIHYYEGRGRLRGHYLEYIQRLPYKYGGHFVPHDGKKEDPFSGDNMIDTARKDFEMEMMAVPKTNATIADIEVCRCGFTDLAVADTEECRDFMEIVAKYHERNGSPCHHPRCAECGDASHAADALRTLFMARHHRLINSYLIPEQVEIINPNNCWWQHGYRGDEMDDDQYIIA